MTEGCQIWIFTKTRATEIKRALQMLLGYHYNIIAEISPANDFAETFFSKKEMLKHLSKKDYIILVGGLDGSHLNDSKYSIKEFCSSLQNINIILCDENLNEELKTLELIMRNIKCIIYHKTAAENVTNSICRLLQKEIQKDRSTKPATQFEPQPSTSNIPSSDVFNLLQNLNAINARSGSISNIVLTSANPHGDMNTDFPQKAVKRPREAGFPKKKPKIYNNRSNLTVVHNNINGLMAKENKLKHKIKELAEMNIKIDVLCLTEHNLVDEDVDIVDIPDFELANTIIRDERRGGSCILIRDDLKFRVLPKVEINNHPDFVECCAVKLVDLNVIIICVYRPPRYYRDDIEEFLDELDTMLRRYKKQRVIICGDFNIDILKDDKTSRDFKKVLTDYNMSLAVQSSTRHDSNCCIDNIIHNMDRPVSKILHWNLSDHNAQLLACQLT